MRHIPALRKALPPPFPARSIVYMWIRDEDKPALVVVEGVPRLWLWLRVDVLDNRGLINTADDDDDGCSRASAAASSSTLGEGGHRAGRGS
jgi:hypothetical protein